MSVDLDGRLARTNIVQRPIAAPPTAAVLAHVVGSPTPRRRWARRQPLVAGAVALALAGTATAAVVIADRGPVDGLQSEVSPSAPAVGTISGLLDTFDPGWATHATNAPAVDATPTLGAAGPISGTTVQRDGFQVDVATDGKVVCSTAKTEGGPSKSGLVCADLPIRFDSIPVSTSDYSQTPGRRLLYAVGPDGVSDFKVSLRDGSTLGSAFDKNLATVVLVRGAQVTSWSWTMPDGRRVVDVYGVGKHVEPAN